MAELNEHSNEMAREEKLFDSMVSKLESYSDKQLIQYGAKSIADIFNAIAIEDIRNERGSFDEENAIDYVALLLISFGGVIIGDKYIPGKRKHIEKMFKKASSLAELPSMSDLCDICEALFENENSIEENAEIFHLLYSDALDNDCELAHRLYIIGIVFSLISKSDDLMLNRCKEQMDVMGLHRYVNHKYDSSFRRDTMTGESYYSYEIDMGGESA